MPIVIHITQQTAENRYLLELFDGQELTPGYPSMDGDYKNVKVVCGREEHPSRVVFVDPEDGLLALIPWDPRPDPRKTEESDDDMMFCTHCVYRALIFTDMPGLMEYVDAPDIQVEPDGGVTYKPEGLLELFSAVDRIDKSKN